MAPSRNKLSSDVAEIVQPALRVARGASYLIIQGIIVNGVGVIFFVFATRLLPTVADFGRVTTLNIFALLMVTVGTLGLPTAGTRFIARYVALREQGAANGVYKTILVLGTILSALVLVATILASTIISLILLGSPDYAILVQLVAVDIFFQLLTLFPLGALQGRFGFRENALVNITSNIVQVSAVLSFLIIGIGVIGILYGWIIGDGLGAVLAIMIASRNFSISTPAEKRTSLMLFAAPLYGANLIGYASSYVDRFLVLFLLGAVELGLYSPAVVAAGNLGIVSAAIAGALLPQLTELHARRGNTGFRNATRAASRYLFMLMFPLAVFLATSAGPTTTILAGPRYISAEIPLAILAFTWGLTSISVIVNTSLLALGRTSALLVASILGVISSLSLAPFVEWFGIDGAALTRVVLMVVSMASSWLILRGTIRGVVDLCAFYKALACASIGGASVLVMEFIWYDWRLYGLYLGVGGITYLLCLRRFKILNLDDIALLYKFIPVKLRFVANVLRWVVHAS